MTQSPSEQSGGLSIFRGKMNWRVTYRVKDGKQAVVVIEAGNRSAAFKAIAAKGISPIKVEEASGKVRPNGTPHISRGIIAVSLAVVLVVVGAFYLTTKVTPSNKAARPKTMPSPKPTMREVAPKARAVARTASRLKDAPEEEDAPPRQKIVEMVSVVTNADGSVLERFRTADGKIRSRQSAPKPIFDNASDQIIAMAASGAASGHAMPPMPVMNNADEAFMQSLKKAIKINDDDSDEVKALKENVIAIREEIRQLISEGHSFAEVIKNHRDVVNHGVEMRKEAARMIKESIGNGDNDAARECLDKVNEVLVGMGIEKVDMPLSDEERRELIRARHKNGNL